MDGMYCCSYARFAVRAGIVAAIVGVVLFAAASLAGAQTIGTETSRPGTMSFGGWPTTAVSTRRPTLPSPSPPDSGPGHRTMQTGSTTVRQRRLHVSIPAAAVVLLSVTNLSGGVFEAQAGQDGRTVWDGVYTAGQAARGKVVYDTSCGACHLPDMSGSDEARPLAGERFMQDWREDTLHTLFVRIRNLMPFDEPATLSADAYLDSVAYILEFNGFRPVIAS